MKRPALLLAVALLLLSFALMSYRILWLRYPIFPAAPEKVWQLSMDAYVKGGEKEATVIEFGRAMLRGNHQVPPEMFAKMVSLVGREGTMDIIMIMGDYTMTAMLLNAVDQQLSPDRPPMLPMP